MIDTQLPNAGRPATWIVVADEGRARVFEPTAAGGMLAETEVFERVGDGRDGAPAWPWPGGPQHDAFTQAVARHLAQAHGAGLFSHLILIARGPMLKALYAALPPELRPSVGLLAEADLIDAEAGVILSCLPGRIEHPAQPDA